MVLKWRLPLSEIISDFFDSLKEITSGFASLDYEEIGFVPSELVKLTILLNGEAVDPLSMIVHRSKAQQYGRQLVDRLKEEIPRQVCIVCVFLCFVCSNCSLEVCFFFFTQSRFHFYYHSLRKEIHGN